MKIKLTRKQIKQLATDPEFINVLKVVAYLTGLLLAGYGTASATTTYLLGM